MGKGFLAYFN